MNLMKIISESDLFTNRLHRFKAQFSKFIQGNSDQLTFHNVLSADRSCKSSLFHTFSDGFWLDTGYFLIGINHGCSSYHPGNGFATSKCMLKFGCSGKSGCCFIMHFDGIHNIGINAKLGQDSCSFQSVNF